MDININGFIGDAGFFGGDSFSLKELNAQLANIGTDKEVNVYINSGGGYVTEGFAIYDRLISFANDNGVKVNTVVLGLCGSIATVIAQAGKSGKRSMYQNSDYFIHNPSWSPMSPDPLEADTLQKIANDLKASEDKIVNFYVGLTGQSEEVIREKMKASTTFTAEEAKQMGFVDEVITTNITANLEYKFAAFTGKQIINNKMEESKIKAFINEAFGKFKDELVSIVKPTVKNEMVQTADGSTIYFETVLEVGAKVYTDETMQTPAPDGEFEANGNIYTVVGGVISQITPMQTSEQKLQAQLDAANAKISELEGAAKATNEAVEAAVAAKETELTNQFNEKFTAFQAKFFTGDKLNEEIGRAHV